MSDAGPRASNSLGRDLRVIDQILTGMSMLRDEYQRKATIVRILLLASGVALVLLVFGQAELLGFLSPDATAREILVGLLGGLTFFLTLIDLLVDWRGQALQFSAGAERYAELKLAYAAYLNSDERNSIHEADLRGQYRALSAVAPRIPDRRFLALKQAHLRKVELSKLVSASPGTPLLILRWHLMRHGKAR